MLNQLFAVRWLLFLENSRVMISMVNLRLLGMISCQE
jgi:hypothetical protein